MDIILRIKEAGDVKLYLQPIEEEAREKDEEPHKFILVRSQEDYDKPYMTLTVDDKGDYNIINLRDIDEEEDFLRDKLADFAMRINEALRLGNDLSAVNIPETTARIKPYDPEMIRVEPSNITLREAFIMINGGEINLSPDFQRNVVWDNVRKSRLIESVLLRIPLPVFYFSSDRQGVLSVVDGLQRLTAIVEFMNNKLPLQGLEYLDECEGCTYNSGKKKLDERLLRRFNITQITLNIIDSQSPTKVKYDIFRRLNTGGRPLNSQELRNCLATNKLRTALRSMANSKEFKATTTNSISDTRMDAQEYALRFIRFRMLQLMPGLKIRDYSGSMDDELDSSVELLNNLEIFDYDDYVAAYDRAMINARYLFGRHAFRKVYKETKVYSYRSVINKTLFLSWAVLLADIPTELIRAKAKHESWISILGNAISSDEHYYNMLSYGTNGWKNIMYAFEKAKEIIDEHLGETPCGTN